MSNSKISSLEDTVDSFQQNLNLDPDAMNTDTNKNTSLTNNPIVKINKIEKVKWKVMR